MLKFGKISEKVLSLNKNWIGLGSIKQFCDKTATTETPKTSGYAESFKKFEQINEKDTVPPSYTFESLLKNSKLVDLGDPEGKVVNGKIFHVIGDDLYIDFGWKFHCVCPRPKKNAGNYVRGSKVRLLVKQLELSTKFLGYEKDLTLLEADCILLGLSQERSRQ